jgi:long-subunit acyl-CoA synthetase (AMP-forming)
VGLPLPGVEVKVVPAAEDSSSSPGGSQAAGELAVRGPMLFREYWGRPEATAAAFDSEGFFLTGDTVSLEGQPPYYKVTRGVHTCCVCVSMMCAAGSRRLAAAR